jgi:hypothetical protein
MYGGAQGIWVDATRTRHVDPTGVTVALLHTGLHYADDLSEDGLLYHFPTTRRGGRDSSEVEATKTAARLGIPVFVITRPTPNSRIRNVRLAYVTGWDDPTLMFFVEFEPVPDVGLVDHDESDEKPFMLVEARDRRRSRSYVREGQQKFKFRAIQRYKDVCAVSGISVYEMLDAAHVCPVEAGGSNDPRNALVLSAAHHRAFDSHLFGIEPNSLIIATVSGGPSRERMGIRVQSLEHLAKKPHPDAVEWRWERFLRTNSDRGLHVLSN